MTTYCNVCVGINGLSTVLTSSPVQLSTWWINPFTEILMALNGRFMAQSPVLTLTAFPHFWPIIAMWWNVIYLCSFWGAVWLWTTFTWTVFKSSSFWLDFARDLDCIFLPIIQYISQIFFLRIFSRSGILMHCTSNTHVFHRSRMEVRSVGVIRKVH